MRVILIVQPCFSCCVSLLWPCFWRAEALKPASFFIKDCCLQPLMWRRGLHGARMQCLHIKTCSRGMAFWTFAEPRAAPPTLTPIPPTSPPSFPPPRPAQHRKTLQTHPANCPGTSRETLAKLPDFCPLTCFLRFFLPDFNLFLPVLYLEFEGTFLRSGFAPQPDPPTPFVETQSLSSIAHDPS